MGRFRTWLLTAGVAVFATLPAAAFDGVVASIKPVHSLVAGVMHGIGKPHLIVRGNASPHTYSLRPSDAKALESAKLIFWIGPNLEAFLDGAIDTLAGDVSVVALSEAPGLTTLPFREGGAFDAHDDREGAGEVDHIEEHQHGEAFDQHIWLDPQNANVMVSAIEKALIETNPANADAYKANADVIRNRLAALQADLAADLAPLEGRRFIAFHDAYQYFENRFGVRAAGTITVSPEIMPGAERLKAIRTKIAELGATCVFAEPQFEPRLITVVTEGTKAGSGTLDPEGATYDEGPELYFDLMRGMAASLKACLLIEKRD